MSLEADRERGRQAQAVLETPVYIEAHDAIEQEVIRQWREARNPHDREQLHQFLMMHAKVKAALEQVMRTGELAAAEIGRKQTRAEKMLDAFTKS